MARSLLMLLLLAVALPAGAATPTTYPWWGQTTSNLNIRSGDEVVRQLAKGQTVYVLGPDAQEGWVQIEYDLYPDTQHRVSAAYLIPFALPERQSAKVGERGFRVLMGSVVAAPPEVTIGGQTFPPGTAFDYVKEGEQYRLIGPDGSPSHLTADDIPQSYWLTVKWDWANNVPTTLDERGEIFSRYYHGFTRLLARGWFFWLLFLGLFAYVALFAFGIGYPQVALWSFLLLIPLWMGSCQGERYTAFQDHADIAGGLLEGIRAEGRQLKPFPSSWLRHEKGGWITFNDWLWVPTFVLCHLILLPLFPYAFRGAHFLFVPHPAEKQLTSVLTTGHLDTKAVAASVGRGDMANPPPKWVSDNQKRRLDALRERFRSESSLLNSVIDFKRKKAELEDP